MTWKFNGIHIYPIEHLIGPAAKDKGIAASIVQAKEPQAGVGSNRNGFDPAIPCGGGRDYQFILLV
ncbi:hypothetical protein [Rubidibacter lacunae]|uniref:hypothetical protein n=1 Tax=Rubidibacter lacunae TaxID=582514 RepID=UPI001E39E0E7|nr:hypothetical protein [Rubidibacter lacunae]